MGKVAKPVNKPYYVFNGFNAGLKPQKIINMKQSPGGKNYFLVKWRKIESPTYVEAEVAKKMCPLLVCEFYQKHFVIKSHGIVKR